MTEISNSSNPSPTPPLQETAPVSAAAPPPLPALPPAKVIYVVDSSRASFGELWRDQRPTSVIFAWIAKIVRKRLVGSVNDPNVETLAPFEIDIAASPLHLRTTLDVPMRDMHILGFDLLAMHDIDDLFNQSRTRMVTMQRADGGAAVGRIWHRAEGGGSKIHFYIDFLSELSDGTFVWTTAAKSVLDAPPQMHVTAQTGTSAEALWQLHQAAVQRRIVASGAQPVPASGREQVLALVERHHAIVRDFHLARKLFRPMRPTDLQRASEIRTHVDSASAAGMANPEVWAELVRMQQRKTGFGSAALLLVISLGLFVGIGAAKWDWELVGLFVGILAFHELGHFVAMKIFRYRNVRMFFIPLLGAAVSGVNYSAPGWKKVIVALMGPLPGILLGAIVVACGAYANNQLLLRIGGLALALNGLNLLPVLPLDGGRVMHTLFFARHWMLDLIFRIGAAIVLIAGSWAAGDRILMFLGIFMLIGIPIAYKLARVASDLRRDGIRRATADEQMIPPDVANQIIARIKKAMPVPMTNRTIAQHTLNVYETLNTHPPGWFATTAFTFVHVGAVLFALLAGVGAVAAQRGGIGIGPMFSRSAASRQFDRPPSRLLLVEQMQVIDGDVPKTVPTTAPATIIATFPTPDDARNAFDDLRRQRTPIALFGQTIMLPVGDRATRERWFDELDRRTKSVYVETSKSGHSMALNCLAPDANMAEAAAEEAREYLSVPEEFKLIPPWSPVFRSQQQQQRQAWHRARRTFVKLHTPNVTVFDDPQMRQLLQRMNNLRRRGDDEELAKVEAQRDVLFRTLRNQRRRALLNPNDAQIDVELGQAYLKRMEEYERKTPALLEDEEGDEPSRPSAYAKLLETLSREIGPRMGQIELSADGKPVNRSDRYSARGGNVSNTYTAISFRWLWMIDPYAGAPALAQSLKDEHHCWHFRYDFDHGADYPDAGGNGGGAD